MAERSATVVRFGVHTRGESQKTTRHPLDFDNALDMDVFEFVEAAWNEIDSRHLRSEKYSRLYIPEETSQHGGVLVLRAQAGFFGEPGQIYDTAADAPLRQHNGELANMTPTRVGVVKASDHAAALVFEHSRSGNLRHALESALRDALTKRDLALTADFDALTRGDAWLEHEARLKKVEIVRERASSDAADPDGNIPIPVRRSFSTVPKGTKFFPEVVYRRIKEGTIKPSDVVSLPASDGGDVDTVKITVGDDAQTRTYILDNPQAPAFKEMIPTKSVDGMPTDGEFCTFCKKASVAVIEADDPS